MVAGRKHKGSSCSFVVRAEERTRRIFGVVASCVVAGAVHRRGHSEDNSSEEVDKNECTARWNAADAIVIATSRSQQAGTGRHRYGTLRNIDCNGLPCFPQNQTNCARPRQETAHHDSGDDNFEGVLVLFDTAPLEPR